MWKPRVNINFTQKFLLHILIKFLSLILFTPFLAYEVNKFFLGRGGGDETLNLAFFLLIPPSPLISPYVFRTKLTTHNNEQYQWPGLCMLVIYVYVFICNILFMFPRNIPTDWLTINDLSLLFRLLICAGPSRLTSSCLFKSHSKQLFLLCVQVVVTHLI